MNLVLQVWLQLLAIVVALLIRFTQNHWRKKISSVKNTGNICFSKATGKKMLPELRLAEHDKNKQITRKAARRIENYLQSSHNPANVKRARFDV